MRFSSELTVLISFSLLVTILTIKVKLTQNMVIWCNTHNKLPARAYKHTIYIDIKNQNKNQNRFTLCQKERE